MGESLAGLFVTEAFLETAGCVRRLYRDRPEPVVGQGGTVASWPGIAGRAGGGRADAVHGDRGEWLDDRVGRP